MRAAAAAIFRWPAGSSDSPARPVRKQDAPAGQALGLPFFMAAFSFVGLAVTSATPIIFGTTLTDPVVGLPALCTLHRLTESHAGF